ncbi:uncharacterized protein G2W53_002007 [Senna tora]|uniref:Uncharacterized protein n=1 Tax=Senna tora TaxID=362788 RepID=A0A835CN25_9FABA|nr:uncharacterized protein G2W53_002007 [Senna tora]
MFSHPGNQTPLQRRRREVGGRWRGPRRCSVTALNLRSHWKSKREGDRRTRRGRRVSGEGVKRRTLEPDEMKKARLEARVLMSPVRC